MTEASKPLAAPGAILPNFLVVGAMRAGTTTLYQALRGHPSVHMAAVKETNFFVFERGLVDLPLNEAGARILESNSITSPMEYLGLFKNAEGATAIGEVSPSYLFSPGAAARIHQWLPDSKIVILLRDPVNRAYSAYLRRAGVAADPASFLEVAEAEDREYRRGVRQTHYPVIAGSQYAHLLAPYLQRVPRSQIWIETFEHFWADPEESLKELQFFLGLEPRLNGIAHLNRSGVPRYQVLDAALRKGTGLKSFVKTRFPPAAVSALVNFKQRVENWSLQDPERLPEHIRSRLVERYFLEDIEETERLIERDLDSWRRI